MLPPRRTRRARHDVVMAGSVVDEWVWALDAARRDVYSAEAAVREVLTRASGLATAMAWVSPAMRAFQDRSDAWRAELDVQLRTLEGADDALAVWRSYLLVHGSELVPLDLRAWLIASIAEHRSAHGDSADGLP